MSKWITVGGLLLLTIIVGVAILWLVANARYRSRMAETEAAWAEISSHPTPAPDIWHPDMADGLPEIARRYLNHAIAPGTPLHRRVEITMSGDFLLGKKDAQQTWSMQARQILAAPNAFVWIVDMTKGVMRLSGSDGLLNHSGWTRFWMFSAIPLVQQSATPDLNRAAAARPAIEAIWAPATLLPSNGATWVQTAPDTAEVTFSTLPAPVTVTMKMASDGGLREIWTQRWTDENPAKTFQLQPFGGIIESHATFDGFAIPDRVTVGNHFGTPDFLPFFRATLTNVRYF